MTMPSGKLPTNMREEVWISMPIGEWVATGDIRALTGQGPQVSAEMHKLAAEGLVVEQQQLDGRYRWMRTEAENGEGDLHPETRPNPAPWLGDRILVSARYVEALESAVLKMWCDDEKGNVEYCRECDDRNRTRNMHDPTCIVLVVQKRQAENG